jgi:2-oxoglutarate dehydrogenase E2 component (dihydrolipoamide succinyltransferase)
MSGIEIIVPPLGESIQEATILSLVKKVGESIKVDELVAELETEKVTLEINAPIGGLVSEILVSVGDTVRVGQVIGRIAEGSSVGELNSGLKSDVKQEIKLDVKNEVKSNSLDLSNNQSHKLSPAVERVVNENNLNPNNIIATGKDGRLTKGDVLFPSYKDSNSTKTSTSQDVDREVKVKMTKLRQTIARRLKDSQNTAAILTTFNEIDMSELMALRNLHKDAFEKKHKVKLGFMSFFVKAVCNALMEIPAVNAEIKDDSIIYKNYCDIGVAVGTEKGLVVPIVRDAHLMDLAQIEKEIYNYGIKARDGQIEMKDMAGGTFTISNGGVYGSLLSTPIINPPQSGILGMHKIQERPVAINGEIKIRQMMYIALSYDHRIIDGKEAVTFLVSIKNQLEDPRRMLLGI